MNDAEQPVNFFNKVYKHDNRLKPVIDSLRTHSMKSEITLFLFEEKIHELVNNLIMIHRDVKDDINKLSALKLSTRIEIYKRLNKAKDFLDDNYNNKLSLSQISKEASLSSHHIFKII